METTDNKKIILTNRSAVAIGIFLIGTTFSATLFYSQTQYQTLVAEQNRQNAKVNKERIEEVFVIVQEQLKLNHQADKEYTTQEVIGLREDWLRDKESQEKRFEKLEK